MATYSSLVDTTGQQEYQRALEDWQKSYGTYSNLIGQAKPIVEQSTKYLAPGGEYGAGQKQEAEELVRKGTYKDMSQMVASGMSSQAGAKGLQTLANTELGKMYKNIEDTRAQLYQQSITPYMQLAESLSQIMSTRPSYRQYVTETTDQDIADILRAQNLAVSRTSAKDAAFWA